MKISYNWLQTYIEEKLPEPEVLAEKIIFGAFEVEDVECLPLLGGVAEGRGGTDTVFEIKVLPDRAHDCLSHYGIAREVCGLLGLTLKPLTFKNHESVEGDVQVTIETDMCRRYIGRKVFGVTVGPSPAWLVERLESIEQRSINNIVDATNYIMFGLGQPIHAFDYDKVSNGKIIIRNATEGEQITTLDGKEITLSATDAVIADSEKVLAIAGVKGGNAAEVTTETKSIIIEVANFDPISVRKTARKLGILTDSAKRFENELTPHLAGTVIHIITDLICELAGGQPCDPIDDYKQVAVQNTIIFSSDYINNILGTDIAREEIKTILNNYGYNFEEEDELFKVLIPYERLDLIGPHDMVEEIGRAYGYEKIIPVLPNLDFKPTRHETFDTISAIKLDLISKGYNEVMTYSFTKKGDFEVARGPVGKSALRTNLSDALKSSYELNKQNADLLGISEMKIFEVGTVFPKTGEVVHVAFADKKGISEMTLDEYVERNAPLAKGSWHEALRVTEGSGAGEVFVMWSEYPFITRDIALWIPSETNPDEVLEILKSNGTSLLAREPKLFDTFSKDGKTSVAFRLVFQSFERTLMNEEVDKVMEVVYEKVKEKGWEVR